LYDLTNNTRTITTLENNVVKVVLPAGSTDRRKCMLVSAQSIQAVAMIEQRNMNAFDFSGNTKYNYIIISHPNLMNNGLGTNYVQEYADYRASAIGGGYEPIIVDVEQLYDQFGYGIERHELAIRNFLDLASIYWESEQLFFIGKGIDKVKMRRDPSSWTPYALVPPFGYPHSDYLFVMSNEDQVPKMAVGRIAAYFPSHVRLYLDKVKEFEAAQIHTPQTIADKAWQKRILHFGGGDINIQDNIRNGLNSIKNTIETGPYGANVISFFKNSTDVLQDAPADEVEAYIEDGASMLTFFGHSSPKALDYDIAEPSTYQNKGKYPFFYAIGCNTNRVFDVLGSLSEEYVLIKDQGSIAFLGSTWVTNLAPLQDYASFLYGNLANDFYGAPLGTVIQETIKDFSTSDRYSQNLIKEGMMLHGDPAVKLYPHPAPDYLVNVQDSRVSPEVINLRADSFQLDLTITNIGKAVQDSISLQLEHLLPNGSIRPLRRLRIAAPAFETKVSLKLPLEEKNALIGRNQIIITVDVDSDIAELPAAAEDNNRGRVPFFAVSNEAQPVSPPEFSIVNDSNVKLQASTTNAFASSANYYLEIDTTILFNSPLKHTTTIEQSGGVITWQPDLNWSTNQVYYWRISPDSTSTSGRGFVWNNSSFTYLPDEIDNGWSQGHYFQYLDNDLNTLAIDSMTRTWTFKEKRKTVNIRTSSFKNNVNPGGLSWGEVGLSENSFDIFSGTPCKPRGTRINSTQILMAEYHPITLERDTIIPPLGETPNCKNKDLSWYIFHLNNTAERAKFIETLQGVKAGQYVALFTTQPIGSGYYAEEWAADTTTLGTNIFQVLEEQGARRIRDVVEQQTPYIFIFKKDDPSFFPTERHANSPAEDTRASAELIGISSVARVKSPLIGPASSWKNVSWRLKDLERSDNGHLNIYGVNRSGIEILLYENIQAKDTLIRKIRAEQFPFLRLEVVLEDPELTPPKIDYWRVRYEPVLDIALAPNQTFVFHADTLQQGEKLHLELGVANLGIKKSDSLVMQYTVIDTENRELKYLKRERPLEKQGDLITTFDIDTRALAGKNLAVSAGAEDHVQAAQHMGAQRFER
ncbi:MAG: C25 family cysteine peptidase, partial [Bacteroidota bacterium]